MQRDRLNAAFVLILVCILMWAVRNAQDRIVKLELRCDGRCQYGDKACKDHCDKMGHCPMEAK